jgi:hypothetical protein
MQPLLAYDLHDVALAVLLVPVGIWLLWDLLRALGGSPSRPAGGNRVDAAPAPRAKLTP